MTLIVGIKARNGAVLGADGAATLGSAGSLTIRQPVKKLRIVGTQGAVGVSGFVGLGQRIVAEIEELWRDKQLGGKSSFQVMTLIRQKIWEIAGVEMQAAAIAQQVLGQAAQSSAVAHTLVALPCGGEPCLYQFDPQGAPEEATEDLPFIAIGTGQNIADPFLAFLRRIFWKNRLPSISEGVFAAVWTLQHAIQTSPGFVSDPIQIIVVERTKKSRIDARELTETDLEEHNEAIAYVEENLADLRRRFSQPQEGEPPPSPPTPPQS